MRKLVEMLAAWIRRVLGQEKPALPPPFIMPEDSDQPHFRDYGQHDIWKRDMALALWRLKHDTLGPSTVDLAKVGLTPRSCMHHLGPLLPLSVDLCAASRRIGFMRLAVASGVTLPSEQIVWLYEAHHTEAHAEAIRRFEVNKKRAEQVGEFPFDSIEATEKLFDLGPLDPPQEGAVPLTPLTLTPKD